MSEGPAALRQRLRTWRDDRRRRVTTTPVLQMEAVECGAASLGIILRHFGRHVALEQLREDCRVGRDGTSASNIVAAAAHHGLTARGFRLTAETLREQSFPVVIHWQSNHFLVVEGFGGDQVFLNDPAAGRYRVTQREFAESFTGITLRFERTAAFVPGRLAATPWTGVRQRMGPALRPVLLAMLASLGLVLPGLAFPAYGAAFIDNVIARQQPGGFVPLALLMLATLAVSMGFGWLQSRTLLRLETSLAVAGAGRFVWHLLHLPLTFFDQRFAGDVANRVGINDRVAALVGGTLARALLSVVTAVFFLALMVRYDVVLTLIAVVGAVTSVLWTWLIGPSRADAQRRLIRERARMQNTLQQGLRTIESVKASGAEGDFHGKWVGHFARTFAQRQVVGRQETVTTLVPEITQGIVAAVMLAVGAHRVIEGTLTVGMLTAFQVLAQGFVAPVGVLVGVWMDAQLALGELERLDDVLAYPPALPTTVTPPTTRWPGPPRLEGHVELRDVQFGYSRDKPPLVRGISFTVAPGQWLALVGRSGCGKSTIARLVTGLQAPWAGEILLDGYARDVVPRTVLTDSVALVDQDVVLFSGSIRDNLSLWDTTIPERDLIRAARDAQIHDMIVARPQGYDAPLGERGSNLSGGQRQRLEIARALTTRPSIVLLDEATSALDAVTEQAVIDALRRRGCTVIVIAHRLSTIRDCDEILVLDAGVVIERGTHDALVRAQGAYARLLDDELSLTPDQGAA